MSDSKTLPDIPVEKIQEVSQNHPSVIVKLRRTTPRGQWASVCAPVQKVTLDLIQPEGWLKNLAGGGAYQIQAFSCANPAEQVIPSFMVNIEGLPKQASLGDVPPEWQAPGLAPGRQPPVFQGGHEMRDYDRNAPPHERQWERPPDAIATERAREERSERLTRERRWEEEKREMQSTLAALQTALNEQRERHQQEILAQRERALEAKIEAALAGTKKPSGLDAAGIAALASAMAPVLIALINSGKERAAVVNDSTAKMHEMHLQGINTMLEATARQPKMDLEKLLGTVMTVVPALAPLVKEFFDSRSPAKTAEVITSMSQSSLEMLGMVTQILQQTVPESDNPWHQVVQKAIGSVGEMLERVAASNEQSQQRQQQLPSPQQQQQPATTPEGIAKAICAAPQVHPTLRTSDWEQVYVRLHRGDAPAEVAEDIAALLDQMAGAGTLPPFLERVFVDPQASTYLAPFLYQLPVSQNPQYVRAVLEAFDVAVAPEEAAPSAPVAAPKPVAKPKVPAARVAARKPINGEKPRIVNVRPETPEDLPALPPLEADTEEGPEDFEGGNEQLVGFDLEPAENP